MRCPERTAAQGIGRPAAAPDPGGGPPQTRPRVISFEITRGSLPFGLKSSGRI